MSDIAERLRALTRYEHDDVTIGDEAAAEIERLCAELESTAATRVLHDKYKSASCDDVARRADECIALRVEVAALRARCRTYRKTLRELNRAHAVLWRVIAIRNDRCSAAIRDAERFKRDKLRNTMQLASDILHGKHHDDQGRAYDAALEAIDAALAKEGT